MLRCSIGLIKKPSRQRVLRILNCTADEGVSMGSRNIFYIIGVIVVVIVVLKVLGLY